MSPCSPVPALLRPWVGHEPARGAHPRLQEGREEEAEEEVHHHHHCHIPGQQAPSLVPSPGGPTGGSQLAQGCCSTAAVLQAAGARWRHRSKKQPGDHARSYRAERHPGLTFGEGVDRGTCSSCLEL